MFAGDPVLQHRPSVGSSKATNARWRIGGDGGHRSIPQPPMPRAIPSSEVGERDLGEPHGSLRRPIESTVQHVIMDPSVHLDEEGVQREVQWQMLEDLWRQITLDLVY